MTYVVYILIFNEVLYSAQVLINRHYHHTFLTSPLLPTRG